MVFQARRNTSGRNGIISECSFCFYFVYISVSQEDEKKDYQLRVKIMRVRVGCFEKMEEGIKKSLRSVGKQMD